MSRELNCLPFGRLWVEETPLRLTFRFEAPLREDVCKLYLLRGDRELLLGTPMPGDGALRLTRSLSRSALQAAGVWPPDEAQVRSLSGERHPKTDRPQVSDPLVARLLAEPGWRWRRERSGFLLCHPWRPGAPVPGAALCCFLTLRRDQVLLRLNGEGLPILPTEDGR